MAASHEHDDNDVPALNPVAARRPLRPQLHEVNAVERDSKVVLKLADNQIAFCTRLDQMDADLVELGKSMILGFASIAKRLDNAQGLPPMRRREDSFHAIVETAQRVSEEARRKAQAIADNPATNLGPDEVQKLVDESVKTALEAQREADRVKQLEAAQKKVEEEKFATVEANQKRREERRKFFWSTASGIIVGLVVLYVTYLQGRLAGHSEGFVEAQHVQPAVIAAPTTVAPTVVASSTVVPSIPASPAMAVPAAHR